MTYAPFKRSQQFEGKCELPIMSSELSEQRHAKKQPRRNISVAFGWIIP